MHIVGFGCTAQVGKDTATEYLEKKYPGKIKRVGFADKLKKIAMELFGLNREQCYGPQIIKEMVDPRYGIASREIMQGIGEKMRQVYQRSCIIRLYLQCRSKMTYRLIIL